MYEKCCSHQGLGTLIASFGRDAGTREWKHALKTYCSARLLTLEPNSIMAGALAGAAFAGSEFALKFFGVAWQMVPISSRSLPVLYQ